MIVREQLPGDTPALAALTPEWTSLGFADRVCLIAVREGEVAGMILLSAVPPDAEILNLFVAPEYRRQGVGRALLEGALKRAAGLGVRKVWLEVRESNQGAIALYQCNGFRLMGHRSGYYNFPLENALTLETILTSVLA